MAVTTILARLAGPLLCAACLVSGLCGCKSLYLHSDAARLATANARAELDNVDVASVFDNEAAYLDDLQKREYAAVAEFQGARRDADLLIALQGTGKSDGRTELGKDIDGNLTSLVCTSDRGGTARFSTTLTESFAAVSVEKSLADSLAQHLARDRPKMPACASATLLGSGASLGEAIEDVQNSTRDLQDKQQAAQQAQEELTRSLKEAGDRLAAGTASQQTFTDLLTKVNGFLKEAEDRVNPFLSHVVSKTLLESVDHLIEVTDPKGLGVDPGDSRARAAIGFVHAAFGVGDAFSKPPRVPHPNALAATRAWLVYVASRGDTQLARAQAHQAFLEARLAAVAQQVYYLSLAGRELDSLGSTPALRRDEGLEKLLADKEPATRRAAGAALYYYAAAWSKGFIPAAQLDEAAGPLGDRRAKLQESRNAGEAWLGTLKPAVATLAAYGEGGIDPHAIAELLQVLGITAVAVGVN